MKVVSIGDLVTDYYYKNGKLMGVNGGMSSHNIIINLANLGLETSVIGACGNDMAGTIAIKSLKDCEVDVSNIKIDNNLSTRCFHVSYTKKEGTLSFISKKRCPVCNQKKWYETSQIDVKQALKNISKDDILVFDNLNQKNSEIIDKSKNRKMLDLGQYFELDNYSDDILINKIKNKFDIINLNERVEKYLKNRFNVDIYSLLSPKMLIITRGKKGTDFVFNKTTISKRITKPSPEIDPTGAGDAFFSVIIYEYIKNNYIIDNNFIDLSFEKGIKLTSKVVKKFGARGHIQNLYKIKKIDNKCICDDFSITTRKRIKRCNININNLETRIINAINSNVYNDLKKINFASIHNPLFIGTGGSYAAAMFASKVINNLYGTNTICDYPRNILSRNNSSVDGVIMFSYSGTTSDLITATSSIDNNIKYIITKGQKLNILNKTSINKNHIISYRTNTNKGREKGFLSFEGVCAPASLFLKLYLGDKDIEQFIRSTIQYWKNHFENYFKINKTTLKSTLKKGASINIFTGDYTNCAGVDLESKLIESGYLSVLLHEKKNFSHGRFINYEHISSKINIYFKQKETSNYEKLLLEYLKNDNTIIIESKYNGIMAEYDLLISSQFLTYFISNLLDTDLSKPTYSEDAMKIYFYKGKL